MSQLSSLFGKIIAKNFEYTETPLISSGMFLIEKLLRLLPLWTL
jgi:hypothetical protein